MSNVVSLARLSRNARPSLSPGGLAPLLAAFAHHRRRQGDAWWLKENAELLGILSALNRRLPELALSVYQPFHEGAAEQMAFHPQYYRLILGVVTALEDLGYPGDLGPRLAEWIVAEGWIDSEVNDLQRAEVRHLLARAGQQVTAEGLDARLLAFLSRPATFAIPNPRAAYDMLHVVFYLSDYGRRAITLPEAAVQSLHVLGCLAHLEQNTDLLAEVCIALHYAGQAQPALWRDFLQAEARNFRIEPVACVDSADGYHNYLVNQWLIGTNAGIAFDAAFGAGPMSFRHSAPMISPLREWSQALLALGARRSSDWAEMRAACADRLSSGALSVADAGAAAAPEFQRFFAAFARAASPLAPDRIRARA